MPIRVFHVNVRLPLHYHIALTNHHSLIFLAHLLSFSNIVMTDCVYCNILSCSETMQKNYYFENIVTKYCMYADTYNSICVKT